MEGGVAVRVLVIGVSTLGEHQPEALLLPEARGEAERILAPIHVSDSEKVPRHYSLPEAFAQFPYPS